MMSLMLDTPTHAPCCTWTLTTTEPAWMLMMRILSASPSIPLATSRMKLAMNLSRFSAFSRSRFSSSVSSARTSPSPSSSSAVRGNASCCLPAR